MQIEFKLSFSVVAKYLEIFLIHSFWSIRLTAAASATNTGIHKKSQLRNNNNNIKWRMEDITTIVKSQCRLWFINKRGYSNIWKLHRKHKGGFLGRVWIKCIAITKCDLPFYYCNARVISFYYFCNTRLCVKHKKNRHEFHLYSWYHVCTNEWCLVDCFHQIFRFSTQIIVWDYSTANCKKFSTCSKLPLVFWDICSGTQNIYINLYPAWYVTRYFRC